MDKFARIPEAKKKFALDLLEPAGVKVVVASVGIMRHQEVSLPPLTQGSDKPSLQVPNS